MGVGGHRRRTFAHGEGPSAEYRGRLAVPALHRNVPRTASTTSSRPSKRSTPPSASREPSRQHLASPAGSSRPAQHHRQAHTGGHRRTRPQRPPSDAGVATAAGVSRSWLYDQPELIAAVTQLRERTTTDVAPIPGAQGASNESLRQRLETAYIEIERLRTELMRTRPSATNSHAPPASSGSAAERCVTDMSTTQTPQANTPSPKPTRDSGTSGTPVERRRVSGSSVVRRVTRSGRVASAAS